MRVGARIPAQASSTQGEEYNRVKRIEDLTWKDWALGGVVGGIGGFLLGYLSKNAVLKWKADHGIDPDHLLHHADIGSTVATVGALSAASNPYAPYVTGFGLGLAVEDAADHIGYRAFPDKLFPKAQTDVFEAPQSELPERTEHHIVDYPPVLRYKGMTDTIRKIIYEDSNNPIVRRQAEDLIRLAELDGRDYESILMTFQLWILDNLTYVHDPARAPDGGSTDRYAHAYITLPHSEDNPKGTGMGDCDDLFIVFASMAMSVGIPGMCGVLVDQTGRGYGHIMAGWCPSGTPKSVKDVTCIELTEDQPFGWKPRAKRYGLLLL